MEAGVLIGLQGEALYWHLPQGRTAGSLPESPELWDVFWVNRARLSGFAHSHPGFGPPGPSYTDVTTFAAIEAGLGKHLDWWITTANWVACFRWAGPDTITYRAVLSFQTHPDGVDPGWVKELRRVSGQQM